MGRRKLLHIRSNVVENGEAKLPTSEQIEYGELAINFADGYETLSIRNSNDEIVKFSNDTYFENIISEDEKVTAAALNDLNTKKADRTEIPEVDMYFDRVEYVSSVKTINFYNNNVQKAFIDATDFIKDGMVNSVLVEDIESGGTNVKCLVVTFNTDAGKDSINIPISHIFDSNLYYTKTESDTRYGKVDDVLVNGASIVLDKVATIPTATTSSYGVVVIDNILNSASTNPVCNSAITKTILDDEKAIAASLNDLNTRKADKTEVPDVSGYFNNATYDTNERSLKFYNGDTLKDSVNANDFIFVDDVMVSGTSIVNNKKVDIPIASSSGYGLVIIDNELNEDSLNAVTNSAITKVILENELITSAALSDLDERIDGAVVRIEDLEEETSKLNTVVGPSEANVFDTTDSYAKGDFVMYDGKLYKFNENHAAGEWNASEVTETNLFSEIEYMTKNDYEEVVITLQNESGTPLPDVLVAVQVEGEESARNFTSDTYGMCTTNVSKGLDYTVSANNVEGYYPTTPISRRASLPKRYVNVTYVVDDTLTQEHLQVTLSYSNTALTTANWVKVSYDGTDYQLSVVNNVAETDIPLGTVYQVSFEEITGYRTPNVRTFTAEHHGTRPLNIRYQAPVSGIRWLMTNNTQRELTDVSNDERVNGEIFGLIVQTSDLQLSGCSYVIPFNILMKSASKTGAWMSVNEEISQMGNYLSHNAALADKNGEENCQKILNYISGTSKTSSMVSGCKNMVGGAPTFSTANTYNIGDYVIYSGNLYTFTVQHNPGAFNVDETSGPMKGYLMPDGVVRQCFSPAYCQLWRFRENNNQVSAFTADAFGLQCINVATDNWWSSSQYNAATGVRLSGGSFNGGYLAKSTLSNLLPVLAY